MKLSGYIRVSRVNQREGDAFIAPKVQREHIEAWAESQGHTIVEWHEDLDQPGSKLARPGLVAVMSEIKSGRTDGVAVAKLDRFGRSVYNTAQLYEEIKEAGGVLISVSEGIDTSHGSMAEFIMNLFSSMAQLELSRIKDGWSVARANAVDRGIHIAGAVPFGYLRDENKILAPDPETGSLVHDLFIKRANGTSWVGLCDYLESRKVETPYGNSHWNVNSVKSIIGNRVYLGEASAGPRVIKANAHKALVTPREYERANQTRGVAPKATGASSGLLSGVLRCAGCRYAMKAQANKSRHGKPKLEYRCKSKAKGAASECLSPATISGHLVDDYVTEFVKSEIAGATEIVSRADDEITKAQLAVEQAEIEFAAYRDDTKVAEAMGGPESHRFVAGLETRIKVIEEAQTALEQAQRSNELAALPELNTEWEKKSLEERRMVTKALLDAVFVWRTGGTRTPVEDRVVIYAKGDGPTDLPTKGQSWAALPLDWPTEH